MHSSSVLSKRAGLVLVVWALATVTVASAGLSPVFFEIKASNGAGNGTFQVMTADVVPSGQTYVWSGSGIPIMDGSTTVATLDSATLTIREDVRQILLTYALRAGDTDTSFGITTAVVDFATINDATGLATASMGITEKNGDTATLTGAGANGFAYMAEYNGGTIFAEFVSSIHEPVAYGSESGGGSTGGFLAFSGPVSDMGTHLEFGLTALDGASSTNNYVIMPEPASLSLVALALAVVCRRR